MNLHPNSSLLEQLPSHDRPLAEILLAVADTKLVLGNWHTICLYNGKSLPDYAALLAMSAAAFGHARALYEYLAGLGFDYEWLERGRDASEIHSQAVLDAPPRDWQDFVVSVYLADTATWLQTTRFLNHADRSLAALARRIGEETWFHLKYASGWATEFARDIDSARRAHEALVQRHVDAVAWFPVTDGDAQSSARRQTFNESAIKLLETLGQGVTLSDEVREAIHVPNAPLLRRTKLPVGLYERVRFKDAEALP